MGFIGGAGNILEVTVTDHEVWIKAPFPANLFAIDFHLEHRIPRGAISKAELAPPASNGWLLLEYEDEAGQRCQVSLLMRNPQKFLQAIEQPLGTAMPGGGRACG